MNFENLLSVNLEKPDISSGKHYTFVLGMVVTRGRAHAIKHVVRVQDSWLSREKLEKNLEQEVAKNEATTVVLLEGFLRFHPSSKFHPAATIEVATYGGFNKKIATHAILARVLEEKFSDFKTVDSPIYGE